MTVPRHGRVERVTLRGPSRSTVGTHGERVLESGGCESTQRVLASEPLVENSERVPAARIAHWQAVRRAGHSRGVRARWPRLTLLGGASLLSFGAPEHARARSSRAGTQTA